MPVAIDKKDELTLLIIPHTGKGPVSLKVPVNVGHFAAAALVVVITFLAVFIHSYLHMVSQMEELKFLQGVTQSQKAEINHLANKTLQLTKQVEEVAELSNQIRDILGMEPAGTEGEERAAGGAGIDFPRLLVDRGGFRMEVTSMELDSLRNTLEVKAEELHSMIGAAEEYQHRMDHTPSIWPAQGRITSPFGYRRSPFNRRMEFHGGIDIANSSGTPVMATASGRVVEASYRPGWGRLVIIDHGYSFRTYYAHLRGYAVSVGDTVTKGEIIAYMGNSGSSTGSHLHYEVHFAGERQDPLEYME